MEIKDRLYTTSEVADILGVSLRSLYRYIKQGRIKPETKTETGRLRFSKKEISKFLYPEEEKIEGTNFYYFYSPLKNLPTIAQKIDKSCRNANFPYAFTLFAGLSLHYRIRPFSIIHLYVPEREFLKRILKLEKCKKKEANVCLIKPEEKEIFEEAKVLKGLRVVSDEKLLEDLFNYSEGSRKVAQEFQLRKFAQI